jgi:hypothetical protein
MGHFSSTFVHANPIGLIVVVVHCSVNHLVVTVHFVVGVHCASISVHHVGVHCVVNAFCCY